MWAFACWDRQARTLLLCRDRFGVKPLYYCQDHGGLAFASEPRALLRLFPAHRSVARSVLGDFLQNSSLFAGSESFYEGIRVLLPGHFALYDPARDSLKISRYWDYPEAEDGAINPARAAEEFAELLEDSVRLRLRSDVPVGLTLSGGLDSSAILAASVVAGGGAPRCYTSVYDVPGCDERAWAAKASAAAGAELRAVEAPKKDWLATLRKIVWHMDSPGYSPAVYPLWCLMAEARRDGVPVLLEGQGADEALAGYPQYAVLDLLNGLSGRLFSVRESLARFRGLAATYSATWALAWMARELSPALLGVHRRINGFASLLRVGAFPAATQTQSELQSSSVRGRMIADHARQILPGLLHYGDAVSMAHSVESRLPFLDFRLVEWMFRLPTECKFRAGETKWLLRQYLRSRGMAEIGNRSDKKGFPTAVGTWLDSDAGRQVEAELTHSTGLLSEWLDPRAVQRLFARQRSGAPTSDYHLYKLVTTRLWLSECVERTVS
jgi:asparagine synthase (glutamine-hydrolysing)